MDTTFYIKAIMKFTEAPNYFYSPVGRNKLLTQDEIETRKYLSPISCINISNKEIVFRRLWEISRLPLQDWSNALKYALKFLKNNNIDLLQLKKIINELIKELNTLDKNNNRVIHNPFLN